ncbi:TylF/MycF/NovP-related O-methyltransferase [Brevundimonas pishanensis]|uniref:TylF/MycF/NovP-related O-methyltransferase n=1 Tax=Brevundimonas pishanensis TaxID=2896315 RepID=UPI001FA76B64|nr:TylF/MycF/NovP-related O-methyltransferase [Brevundimonas pishanensis]
MSALLRAGYSDLPLPPIDLTNKIMGGRSIYDGTVRGVGLEYGDLAQRIEQHPLFIEACHNAQRRSVMHYHRTMNLFLLIALYFDSLESKDIIEFGSYRGGSAIFMATLLARLYPDARIFACDTFEGMPPTDKELDHHSAGDFSNSDEAEINAYARSIGLTNLITVKGLVEDTFPARFDPDHRFGLAHIDLDIYHPIKYIQHAIYPQIVKGGYMVYDDATASSCIGATQAVEEWIAQTGARSEQIYPHFVFRAHL